MRLIRLLSVFLLLLALVPGSGAGGESLPAKKGKTGPSPAPPSILIMDKGKKAHSHLVRFVMLHNGNADSILLKRLATVYINECRREGVNHDVAFCQMCLETGFLRFDGTVSRYQNNFCGLGATDLFTSGDWFGTIEEGVRAHIQHLKAYASWEPTQSPVVDPRFHRVKRGSVFTIFDLTGKWASDPGYGTKIDRLLRNLYGY